MGVGRMIMMLRKRMIDGRSLETAVLGLGGMLRQLIGRDWLEAI